MTDIGGFLSKHGWSNAEQIALAGDASARRYIRLCSGPKRAILMIDPQRQTTRFAAMAEHLLEIGLSAPIVHAHTPELMLLEDFGDAQFASVITSRPSMEHELYHAATEVLSHLETMPNPSGLHTATPSVLGSMIEPVFTHYLPALEGQPDHSQTELTNRLTDLLETHVPSQKVLVLRDYHAENMIWLPDREGVRRVGLLDFQDALIGPPIYDLVSMLQDARRDVSEQTQSSILVEYATLTGRTLDAVMPTFHLLGLQRNLRILGIFARLALENGKPGYLDLIPRVWGHIQTSLRSPVAATLAPIIHDTFPDPSPDRLNKIKSLCQTP